jgi:hypothetical protein
MRGRGCDQKNFFLTFDAGRIPDLVTGRQAVFSLLEDFLNGNAFAQAAHRNPASVAQGNEYGPLLRNSIQYRRMHKSAQLKLAEVAPGEDGADREGDNQREDDQRNLRRKVGRLCNEDQCSRQPWPTNRTCNSVASKNWAFEQAANGQNGCSGVSEHCWTKPEYRPFRSERIQQRMHRRDLDQKPMHNPIVITVVGPSLPRDKPISRI